MISILSGQENGIYFYKKEYEKETLPVYAQVKDKIPVPILEENKEWLEIYWKSWGIVFQRMKQPAEGSPLVSNWLDNFYAMQLKNGFIGRNIEKKMDD